MPYTSKQANTKYTENSYKVYKKWKEAILQEKWWLYGIKEQHNCNYATFIWCAIVKWIIKLEESTDGS